MSARVAIKEPTGACHFASLGVDPVQYSPALKRLMDEFAECPAVRSYLDLAAGATSVLKAGKLDLKLFDHFIGHAVREIGADPAAVAAAMGPSVNPFVPPAISTAVMAALKPILPPGHSAVPPVLRK